MKKSPCFVSFDSDSVQMLIDNGSSATMWTRKQDFIKFDPSIRKPIQGIGSTSSEGGGTLSIKVQDDQGHVHEFVIKDAIYVPTSPANLFCPQQWARQRERDLGDTIAHCDTKGDHLLMEWSDDQGVTVHQKRVPLTGANVGITATAPGYFRFKAFAAFQKAFTVSANVVSDSSDDESETGRNYTSEGAFESEGEAETETERERQTPVRTDFEKNPTQVRNDEPDDQAQDEPLMKSDLRLLLSYHERLGHLSFAQLKILAHAGIIPRKLRHCPMPRCSACLYGKSHRKPWRTAGAKQTNIKRATAPGQVVSVDQLQSPTPGLIPQAKGTLTTRRYTGATVFADHYSDLTYVHLHESLSTNETIKAKLAFEQFASAHGVQIKHYHCDNGRFADAAFIRAVELSQQTISFCGVGAHHQNGIAERRIRDITETTRTTLLHACHRWPGAVTTNLWPQALKNAVNLRNSLPRQYDAGSPLSKFAATTIKPNLKDFHPFGCPVYVLEAPLQTRAPFPKWAERSRVGVYLCHSPRHASSVPLILNTQTGLVSPQFHCVYDDAFDTVNNDAKFVSLWQQKAKLTSHAENNSVSRSPTDPTLECDFSSLPSYKDQPIPTHLRQPWRAEQRDASAARIESTEPSVASEQNTASSGSRGSLHQHAGNSSATTDQVDTNSAQSSQQTQPAQQSTTTRSGRMIRPPQRLIDELHAAFVTVSTAPLLALASMFLSTTHQEVPEDNSLNKLHPLATLISFPATKSDPDTMTLDQALREPDAHKFIEAMESEVADHVARGHWEVVPNSVVPRGNKPIMAVWSMKRKRDPGGAIIKWKARLCAHGGMQTKGINYWETYSPVVSWTTVRLVLILSLIMGWHMRSLDFVMAYPQADIKTDIFM